MLRHLLCLAALTMFSAAAAASSISPHLTVEPPPGFDELASSHVILVDVYYGGLKIAETVAVHRPGTLQFRDPEELLNRIPQAVVGSDLKAAIAQELPTNSEHVCAQSNANDCGVLKPDLVGIIYDEDRFRVDLFINPRFLRALPAAQSTYLPLPDAGLSLTDTIGVDAAGTIGGTSTYDIQNRTIIALRNGRIRADTALASRMGLLVDDLVGEVDNGPLRYSGGLFWAPPNEFIGQRRILGGGVATQFDTIADRQSLQSTPLVVFLAEPSRIELIVDGRLASSRSYPAGNVEVDTDSLAEGSYPVLVRIHHANGSIEDQRRFFVKYSQIPAARHPIVFAFGGVLANTRPYAPVSLSRTIFYELGAASRLSNNIALDIKALGTQHKAIVEAGSWLVTGPARVRMAALLSTSGDWGGLVQFSMAAHGPFTINVDVRRIWSRDGAPLVPLAPSITTFDIAPPAGLELAVGSYTQATASLGLRLAGGFVSLVGAYRKDRDLRSDYTIGPNLSLPLVTRSRVQLVFDASAQRSRTTTAAFAGLRFLLSSNHTSVGGSVGQAVQRERGSNDSSISRSVGSLSAQWSQQRPDGSEYELEADVNRNIGSSIAHAQALASGSFGDIRGDILKNLEDRHAPQYNLAFQSGMAVGIKGSAWGSRDLQQSAIIVDISGDASDASFKVLVDEVPRGELKVGHRLSLFMPGYRTYAVRLVPSTPRSISYDTAERKVTLYPGNVRLLSWRADSFLTLFGQAVSDGGTPIGNALVQTAKGIAQTDARGYFQIDARPQDPITLSVRDGKSCQLKLGTVKAENDFASIGKVICR